MDAADDPSPWRQQAILGRGRWNADGLRDIARDHVVENLATDDAVPGIDGKGGCRSCHVGGEGAKLATVSVKSPVVSSCAMCHSHHMDSGAPWVPAKDRKKNDVQIVAVADRPRFPVKLQ